MRHSQLGRDMKNQFLLFAAFMAGLAGVSRSSEPETWSCVAGPDAQARRQQVADHIQPRVIFEGEDVRGGVLDRMAVHHVPALSVAVIKEGKLDWTAAWGALEAGGTKADCSTLFQGGSLAKPTTLVAALRMKQEGVIAFDEDIEAYLDAYHLPQGQQSVENPVTLRNLFRHTSGITRGGYMGYSQDAALPTTSQILLGEAPANSRAIQVVEKPNEHLAYSGGGYTLIEAALQDHLHQPFEQLMQQWLIEPLGMQQASFVQPVPGATRMRTAKGHSTDGSPVPGGWNNHPERAAAGLWATPSDLALLLLEMHKASRGESSLLDRASMEEMLADPIEGHSYGFRRFGEGDDLFITHYGGTVGYRAGMTINVRTGNGAVYLTNSDGGSELGTEFLNAVSEVYGWTGFKAINVRRITKSVEELQALTGVYDFQDAPSVSVVLEQGVLTLVFPNKDRYAMAPIEGAPSEFIHPPTAVRITFEQAEDGTKMNLYGEQGVRK